MRNWGAVARSEVERFQREIAGLERELTAKKQALLKRLAELFGVTPAAPGRKPGPEPGGRKPGRKARTVQPAGRRGRRAGGGETLPAKIVAVLNQADHPLNAKEIFAGLQKQRWRTKSGDPQAMVYKTLHRIEKLGVIVKPTRGRFTTPKEPTRG